MHVAACSTELKMIQNLREDKISERPCGWERYRGGRICRIRAIDIQRGKDGMGEGDDPREGRWTWIISKA